MSGGTYSNIKAHIDRLDLDTSHFTGQAWSAGKDRPDRYAPVTPRTKGPVLRRRLIAAGREERCESCRLTGWLGQPIPLHVDHIDGDSTNNDFGNLRFLCPTCHYLTPTWGKKKREGP